MKIRVNQDAIVYGCFVELSLQADGTAYLDCLDAYTNRMVAPSNEVLLLVNEWLSRPFDTDIDLQEWFIKSIEDEQCQTITAGMDLPQHLGLCSNSKA